MPSAEKILTLHPAGKRGVNIDRSKYDAMRGALLRVVPRDAAGVPLAELRDLVPPHLARAGFPPEASVGWYLIAVKQDLEARGELEQVPGARPQHLRRPGGAR